MEGEVGFREVWVRRILQKLFLYLVAGCIIATETTMESDCVRTVSQV